MLIHRQGAIAYAHSQKDDVLVPVERTKHFAIAETHCPRCEVNAGFPCKAGNGTDMPLLAVHMERVRAIT